MIAQTSQPISSQKQKSQCVPDQIIKTNNSQLNNIIQNSYLMQIQGQNNKSQKKLKNKSHRKLKKNIRKIKRTQLKTISSQPNSDQENSLQQSYKLNPFFLKNQQQQRNETFKLQNIDTNIKEYYKLVEIHSILDTLIIKYADDPIIQSIRNNEGQNLKQYANPLSKILKKQKNPNILIQQLRNKIKIKLQQSKMKIYCNQNSRDKWQKIIGQICQPQKQKSKLQLNKHQLRTEKRQNYQIGEQFKVQKRKKLLQYIKRVKSQYHFIEQQQKLFNQQSLCNSNSHRDINKNQSKRTNLQTKFEKHQNYSSYPFYQHFQFKQTQQKIQNINKQQNLNVKIKTSTPYLQLQVASSELVKNNQQSHEQQYDFKGGIKKAVVFMDIFSKEEFSKLLQAKIKIKKLKKSINLALAKKVNHQQKKIKRKLISKDPLQQKLHENLLIKVQKQKNNLQQNGQTFKFNQQNLLTLKDCHVCKKCWKYFDDGHRLGGHMAKKHPSSRIYLNKNQTRSFALQRKAYFNILKEIKDGKDSILQIKQNMKNNDLLKEIQIVMVNNG